MPFSFQLTDRPLSYHGRYINIDWYVEARVDLPWAIDVHFEMKRFGQRMVRHFYKVTAD